MKTIIKFLFAAFVLSMVPMVQAVAQTSNEQGHIESLSERRARQAREAEAKKKKEQQEAAAKKEREEEARKKREAEAAAQRQREEEARKRREQEVAFPNCEISCCGGGGWYSGTCYCVVHR